MRLFPFFQSGEPGAVSKDYDTAQTVDRSSVEFNVLDTGGPRYGSTRQDSGTLIQPAASD